MQDLFTLCPNKMAENILVFKRRGNRNEVKITKKMRGGYSPDNCVRNVNLTSYIDLSLFLHDLEDLWNAPIEKAVKKYLEDKSSNWPF